MFFCLFIICQKTVLRATVLHFLSIFGVLRRFCVILEYNLYPFIIRTLGGLSDFEVTNCQPFLLLHSALICFLGISSMLQNVLKFAVLSLTSAIVTESI